MSQRVINPSPSYELRCSYAATCEVNALFFQAMTHWNEAAKIAPSNEEKDRCLEFSRICESKVPKESMNRVYCA